jgi:hypothetical protein
VEDLWPDGELVGRIVGLGARLADRTATTGRGMEADAYHGIARDIPAWGPLDAGLPLGAAGLLGLPIDDEGAQIIPLARPPLVAIRPKGRADHVDLMRGVGGGESLGTDIAAIEQVRAGEEVRRRQVLVDGGAHHAIRRGRGRRAHLGNEMRLAVITGFGSDSF